MEITKTTKHLISFSVEAHWDEEGGMGCDSFGGSVKTIEEAVELFDLACISNPNQDWFIMGTVEKSVAKNK